MAWGYGLKTAPLADGGICVNNIDNGETLTLRGVDFGKKGAKNFKAATRNAKPGAVIEVRLDSDKGPVVATLPLKSSADFSLSECKVKGAKGVHDVVFCFKGDGDNLFEWDYWQFN